MKARAGLWLLLCWALAFTLACGLAAHAPGPAPAGEPLLTRLLGSGRVLFSDRLYLEADRYYHQGVGHHRERAFEDRFSRLAEAITPTEHRHLEGIDVRELTPWFRAATLMDPGNVDAFTASAFLLDGEGNRSDLAEQILIEASRQNPRDYRVRLALSRFYMRNGREPEATRSLDAGLRVWPAPLQADDEEARHDLVHLLTARALVHEMRGEPDEALALLQRARPLAPGNRVRPIQRRIEALERGEDTSQRARGTWQNVFPGVVFHDHHH